MKRAARIALVIGLAVMIGLIVREGGPPILTLLGNAGLILLWLIPLHVLPLGLDVLGWRTLLRARAPYGLLLWIATVREAINRLLPVANIGGDIVGIHLLATRGVATPTAAASVVMEILLTLVSQFLFVTLGVVLVLQSVGTVQPLWSLFLGLALALIMIAAVFILVRYGSVFERLHHAVERMLGVAAGPGQRLDAAILELYEAPVRLAVTVGWQLSGLVAGSLETWLALRWLGHPLDFEDSLSVESLTQAVRNFIFLVPAGLGVQEAGLIGFGSIFGLPPDVALTLSLVKRMREILFGIPALVSWQWAEGWKGFHYGRSRSEP